MEAERAHLPVQVPKCPSAQVSKCQLINESSAVPFNDYFSDVALSNALTNALFSSKPFVLRSSVETREWRVETSY